MKPFEISRLNCQCVARDGLTKFMDVFTKLQSATRKVLQDEKQKKSVAARMTGLEQALRRAEQTLAVLKQMQEQEVREFGPKRERNLIRALKKRSVGTDIKETPLHTTTWQLGKVNDRKREKKKRKTKQTQTGRK